MIVTPARLQHVPFDSDTQRFLPVVTYQARVEDFDYVEEEWFATGEEEGRSYTTWVLVRRPRDAKRFSGTVILEPLHFFPIAPIFTYTSFYILRSGHAYVCVGSQKTSVDRAIKTTNPQRYESLNIEAEPLSPKAAELNYLVVADHPGEEGDYWWQQLDNQNRASKSILAQVGTAVKASGGPFEGFGVKNVILSGHSYTGYVSTHYIREAHDTMRLAEGSPVYDGFFPSGWPYMPFGPRDVPIVQVITDGDICSENVLPYRKGYAGLVYRRPDSDDPSDRYRLYELSAISHTSTQHPPINDLKFLEEMDPSYTIPPGVHVSNLPFNELHQMALHNLVRWVADGVAPPRAARMEDAPNGFFAKDEHGNTRGGVRCIQLEVPRAKYISNITNPDGTRRFGPYGFEEPFDKEKLQRLYKNKAGYLKRFNNRLDELIKEGWFLKEDVDIVRADAEKVDLD